MLCDKSFDFFSILFQYVVSINEKYMNADEQMDE